MKKLFLMQFTLPVAALIYGIVFWNEGMGLNTLLVSIFWLAVLYFFRPQVFQSQAVRASSLGLVFSALMIIINNSIVAKAGHLLSLALLVGFAQAEWLRFIGYGLLLAGISVVQSPLAMAWRFLEREQKKLPSIKSLSFFILPAFIGFIFFIIYYNANPSFAGLVDKFLSAIFNWRLRFLSPGQIILGLIGAVLAFVLCYPSAKADEVEAAEAAQTFRLTRVKSAAKRWKFNPMALRREYRLAVFMFIGLNGLLLLVNLTDITTVWIGLAPDSPQELSNFVHEGTYLLIFSIILASGLVLFLFRGNINFFPNNQRIKLAAGAWIIQNGLLALSVGMRNYHYIDQYGLAYKRIGVLVFLILVGIGLFTLFQKVMLQRSLYYVFFNNSWAWFWLCLVAGAINWDVWITRYNLAHNTHQIDVRFLIKDVSDKNLFLLMDNYQILTDEANLPQGESGATADSWIHNKIVHFKTKTDSHSWLSWNWPDERNRRYFQSQWTN